MKLCPKCKVEHTKGGIFCSRKCANSRVFSKESLEKKRDAALKHYNSLSKKQKKKQVERLLASCPNKKKIIKELNCSFCRKIFLSNKTSSGRWVTYCSDACFIAIKKKNALSINKEEYNGRVYDSSWEVKLAKWMDEHSIKHEQPNIGILWYDLSGKEHKYFPDFYLPEYALFVDPKNPAVIEKQKEKLEIVSKQISLLYGDIEELKSKLTLL